MRAKCQYLYFEYRVPFPQLAFDLSLQYRMAYEHKHSDNVITRAGVLAKRKDEINSDLVALATPGTPRWSLGEARGLEDSPEQFIHG